MPALQIDVVSDVVCPWCYIGKRRLERALAQRPDLEIGVSWRPFQLDPTIPPEGVDRRFYMERKFGSPDRIAEIHSRLEAAGESEGIAFAFDRITRSPNTLDAHRLIRWAATAGLQHPIVERLFEIYFVEGGDIGDSERLSSAADEIGLDSDAVGDLLARGVDRERVEHEIALAHQSGINGVPCFIVDSRLMVMGAQHPDVIVSAIDQALQPAPPEGHA